MILYYFIQVSQVSSTPLTNGHRPKGIGNRWPKGKAKVKGRSSYKQHALKGQKLLAQGNALGVIMFANLSPCKGKSFETPGAICKAFALTGRLADCLYTQGDALG